MLKSFKNKGSQSEYSISYIYDKFNPPQTLPHCTHASHNREMKQKEVVAFEQQKQEQDRKELLSEWRDEMDQKCNGKSAKRLQDIMNTELKLAKETSILERKQKLKSALCEEENALRSEMSLIGLTFYKQRL